MAISETLVQLVNIRDDIRQAIADKGVDIFPNPTPPEIEIENEC